MAFIEGFVEILMEKINEKYTILIEIWSLKKWK